MTVLAPAKVSSHGNTDVVMEYKFDYGSEVYDDGGGWYVCWSNSRRRQRRCRNYKWAVVLVATDVKRSAVTHPNTLSQVEAGGGVLTLSAYDEPSCPRCLAGETSLKRWTPSSRTVKWIIPLPSHTLNIWFSFTHLVRIEIVLVSWRATHHYNQHYHHHWKNMLELILWWSLLLRHFVEQPTSTSDLAKWFSTKAILSRVQSYFCTFFF